MNQKHVLLEKYNGKYIAELEACSTGKKMTENPQLNQKHVSLGKDEGKYTAELEACSTGKR